jgi:hypothetical protein
MTIHRLSYLEVVHAKPRLTKRGTQRKSDLFADGGGLYLQVTRATSGKGFSKSWIFRFAGASTATGRERKMGLGSLNALTLAQAREMAQGLRHQRLLGLDPIEVRRTKSAAKPSAAA